MSSYPIELCKIDSFRMSKLLKTGENILPLPTQEHTLRCFSLIFSWITTPCPFLNFIHGMFCVRILNKSAIVQKQLNAGNMVPTNNKYINNYKHIEYSPIFETYIMNKWLILSNMCIAMHHETRFMDVWMPFCNQDILFDISYIPSSYVPRIAL